VSLIYPIMPLIFKTQYSILVSSTGQEIGFTFAKDRVRLDEQDMLKDYLREGVEDNLRPNEVISQENYFLHTRTLLGKKIHYYGNKSFSISSS